MEERIYNNVGNVLQLNKAGELIQKRMKAVKVCDGLYVTEPDKSGYMQFICELNGVVWLDCKAAENRIADGIKLMPGYFDKIKAGCFDGENIQEFKREISRRINHPDSPAIMELKQPERKKAVPLAENERKVSVYMFKGCYGEKTDKKVVITEVAPHVYTYAYKLKKYGERVKIILEVDGVYFEACDKGSYITEREDFTEVCTKAYEHARQNVADGAASGMAYFIEVQKRIDAATPTETSQISTETAETANVSAEGENAENEPQKHISEVLKEAERNYQCVKSETLRTVREADGKWHTYFMDDEIGTDLAYNQINHIPSARTAQAAEEVAEIRCYLNRLNGNHIADADYYLAEMRDGIRQAEAARRKKNAEAEGEKAAERAVNKPERKIKYFHYTPERLKRYIIDVYEKRANGEWVLLPYEQIDTDAGLWDVVDGKIGWWTNWRREKFSGMNMDFDSPTCGRCCKINRTYQKDNFIVSNEKLLEFTINGNYYYIQKQTYNKGKHRWCYTIMDAHGDFAVNDFSYTKRGIMQRFNKWWKKNATIIWQSSEFAPQSPETPQMAECTADTPKPRETARKRPNRAIGSARYSGLGANGYAMLDNASATLAALYVPR